MRCVLIILAASMLGSPAVSAPQAQQPQVGSSSQIDPAAVVAEVRRVIAERYVLPERRPALDAVLAEGLTSGRYNGREPAVLAERINTDLARVGQDRHLNFNFNPAQAALLRTRVDHGQPSSEEFLRSARASNFGLSALRLLPGNIRYLAYDGFQWTGPETATAIDNAMRFLAGGDAVIIDLRRNGGGDPRAVQYMISHFLPANRHLVTFHFSGEPEDRFSTLAELPAGRMIGKPLYVLTSRGTGSAAEEFTGHVSGFKLGELVGETTAGAGFRNDLVPITSGFVLSVSTGRAVLASTGKDWEKVGISPTIKAPVADALEVAQTHALRRLIPEASPQQRPVLEALADTIAAQLEPRPPVLPLAAYIGQFGDRRIILENGRLYHQRGERYPSPLIALGGNRFALENEPATQVLFSTSGSRVIGFDYGPAGSPPQGRYERTS